MLGDFIHRAFGRAVAAIGFGDDGRHAPEQIFRLLCGRALFVLDQASLLENGACVLRERDRTRRRIQRERHGRLTGEMVFFSLAAAPQMRTTLLLGGG